MDEKNQPLVSVVTPVYNGDKFLNECIQSVLDQTYRNWEFIILNNLSTDMTLKIAQKYAAKDNRIRIYNTDSLLPIMKNWNFALRKISSKSKYCKVVHADDMLFPQCIEQMVSLAEAHPTVGVVGSYGLWGNRVVSDGLPLSTDFLSGRELCRLTLLNRVNCFWSPSSLLIHSDLIRKRHDFYIGDNLHADVEACYDVLKESDFGFVHQVLTFIRRHDESVSSLVAAPYNTMILSNLDLLTQYGPEYLGSRQYQVQLNKKINEYYWFLAGNLFQLREGDFWEYHKRGLNEIGHPFSYKKLAKASLVRLIDNPRATLKLFGKALKKRLLKKSIGDTR